MQEYCVVDELIESSGLQRCKIDVEDTYSWSVVPAGNKTSTCTGESSAAVLILGPHHYVEIVRDIELWNWGISTLGCSSES